MKHEKDYVDFLLNDKDSAPQKLQNQIMSLVESDLSPKASNVFIKLCLIHTLSAMATLSVCPQFGFRLVGQGMGLMHYFMSLGSYGCLMACGALFMGTSFMGAALLLKKEEFKTLYQYKFLQISLIVFLSLGIFMLSPEARMEIFSTLTLAWLVGALSLPLMTLELRKYFYTSTAVD
jgi:hypothetical protein